MSTRSVYPLTPLKSVLPAVLAVFLIAAAVTPGLRADDANATQFLTIAKQAFGNVGEVAIFISESDLSSEKAIIDRAAAQNGLNVKLYIIKSSIDVNTYLKEIADNSVLVIYQSDVLSKKSTILYILSRCKKKQVALITSSSEYSELGALLGLVRENKRFKIVLNLKQNEWLKSEFSEDRQLQLGVSEVIE